MFGFADFWVELALALAVLSTLLCLFWGIINWNRDNHEHSDSSAQTAIWLREDRKIEEELP